MPPYEMIKKRADFLAANRGKRYVTPGFILLAYHRGQYSKRRTNRAQAGTILNSEKRLGITVTKKIGNAVVRNRMKRRFRALAADTFAEHGIESVDHIMIGRIDGIERDFSQMRAELIQGLKKLSKKARKPA